MTHCCRALKFMLSNYFVPHKYLEVVLTNLAHTNPIIPSNLYWTKIWCIILEEQSQGPRPKFTSPTELKSSFPFLILIPFVVLFFTIKFFWGCNMQKKRRGCEKSEGQGEEVNMCFIVNIWAEVYGEQASTWLKVNIRAEVQGKEVRLGWKEDKLEQVICEHRRQVAKVSKWIGGAKWTI